MAPKTKRKRRVPQLKYTKIRNIGWHVSYRDPKSNTPCKHRFGMVSKAEAEREYHQWVAHFLDGILPEKATRQSANSEAKQSQMVASKDVAPGSLLHIASSFLRYEESRTRAEGEPRSQGTISKNLYKERKKYSKEFLEFLNTRHGNGAVKSMQLADLVMEDAEAYNKMLVDAGYSASLVSKRLQFVHTLIKRAGRPEHGSQVLGWNWESRDVLHGKPTNVRTLPSLEQLKAVLGRCSERETALIWLAIGCGFGQRDLAAIRVGQVDQQYYDLRRGKTGIERYGDTPPMVWNTMKAYLNATPRKDKELLFVSRKGLPLVHGNTDSVSQWWKKLCVAMGEEGNTLGGFYVLRHLGATEFGSRKGCSIVAVKRWLGHSASSQVADVYMKPISPEDRPLIEWVRMCLKSGKANLKTVPKRKK